MKIRRSPCPMIKNTGLSVLLSVYRYHSRICVQGGKREMEMGWGEVRGWGLASVGGREEAGGDTAAGASPV